MSYWTAGDDENCDCLTRDDHDLKHAARCATMFNGNGDSVDRTDIRELAELAAYRDIDTALSILRGWMARGGK